MNIIELMETDISNDLSIRPSNLLRRNGLGSIYSIILYKKENLIKLRTMGQKSFNEIDRKLHSLDIDLDDEEKCKEMIKLYISEKINEMDNVVELIETEFAFLSERRKWNALNKVLNTLSNYEYKTIYDLLKENNQVLKQVLNSNDIVEEGKMYYNMYDTSYLTQYGCLVIALMKYGINLEDSESCEILLSKYEEQTSKKEKNLTPENELQTILDSKYNLLVKASNELNRRKELQEALAECDKTFAELIAEYEKLTKKEEKIYEK